MLQWIIVVILAALPLMQGCAAMKTIDGAQEFEMIYFDQGDDEGKLLYQFSEVGKDILPQRMLVDGNGRLFFLERTLNRVQCFSPTGEWSYTVALSGDDLKLSSEDDNPVEINYVDMFWFPDSSLGILVEVAGDTPRHIAVKLDADGFVQSHYELKDALIPLDNIENVQCDALGWLWIAQDEWQLFDHLGNYSSTVKVASNCVDAPGFTYSSDKPVRVLDRHGKLAATLTAEDTPAPDFVAFVDDKGEMVSWTRGLAETKTATSLASTNQIVLFALNRDEWLCEAKATITVPNTEYKFPHEQSDQAIPVQVYLPKMTVVRNGVMYLLAYSDDSIWVSKLAIAALMK